MGVNYWKRHIGDYVKDAGHLSLLEHGAYTVLLDRLYGSERAIPEGDVYRITRASTKAERVAVDSVLREFFDLEDEGWMHGRVREELEKAEERADANRENGKKGGRPRKRKGGVDVPNCPQQEIIALYHEVLPALPPVREWTSTDADNLRARWKSAEKRQTVEWWREFFVYVGKSGFLTGERGTFQASLGWLVKSANFAKVVNGNYEDRAR